MSTVRPVPDGDLEEFLRLEVEIYTLPITFGDGAALRRHLAPDAALAAYADDGRLAGRLITYPLRMWLNGATLAVGGVSGVGVRPEYRRLGLASALLRGAYMAMREAGQAVSLLYPTFYRLYRRNGYALATQTQRYRFRARDLVLGADGGPAGRFEILPVPDRRRLAPLYERFAAADGNTTLVREDWWWDEHALAQRVAPAMQALIWTCDGAPEGYLVFRQAWADAATRERPLINATAQRLEIVELVAPTPRAYRALVGWIAANDLADDGQWAAPDGDPLPSLVLDPRALMQATIPGFMLRVVDLPAALAARPAAPEAPDGRLTLAVADPQADWNAGAWAIALEAGHLSARRTTAAPDLACEISTLSALYNGFLAPERAWRCGLLGGDAAALPALAACFGAARRPLLRETF
jgi:predicted acetyltransferase